MLIYDLNRHSQNLNELHNIITTCDYLSFALQSTKQYQNKIDEFSVFRIQTLGILLQGFLKKVSNQALSMS